jgi:hypothetical protein
VSRGIQLVPPGLTPEGTSPSGASREEVVELEEYLIDSLNPSPDGDDLVANIKEFLSFTCLRHMT